jgi:hypothetical protein
MKKMSPQTSTLDSIRWITSSLLNDQSDPPSRAIMLEDGLSFGRDIQLT